MRLHTCVACGFPTPDYDRVRGPDGKVRHATCAIAASIKLKEVTRG